MLPNASTTPSSVSRFLFVLAILVAMVSVPYLFPAPLSISRSYVAGFSNRTAILLLFIGTGLLAVYTRGKLARTETTDSKLDWPILLAALIFTLGYCVRRSAEMSAIPGGEANYVFNRIQLLAAGLTPYRQFEFVYGPMLLYPILWVQNLLHVSVVRAFDLVWLAFWEAGVVMVWVVVRGIDLPIPSRRLVFCFLLGAQLVFAWAGSMSYSPFRAYLSCFCIVASYMVWKRTKNQWLLALCTLVSVALAICCSMDQAVGVSCGLISYLFYLALPPRRELSWISVVVAFIGVAVCFAYSDHLGLTAPLRSFGGGGYTYPLLPSLGIFAALIAYIVAGCALYRFLYLRFFLQRQAAPEDHSETSSLVLPLVIAGCSMIPNALGRCDVLHITAAIPAFVVGVAVICSMPSVRLWWSALAFVGLICLPKTMHRVLDHTLPLLHVQQTAKPDPALTAQGYTPHLGDNQWYISPSHLRADQLPCDRQYFSPSFMPEPTGKFLRQCLDTGYFLGFTDVITPKTIAYKVEELKQHSGQPLLMENSPLEAQFPLQLAFMGDLYWESETLWVPRERHAPLTYAPIIEYIREHYVPGPLAGNGSLQIWYPAAGNTPASYATSAPAGH